MKKIILCACILMVTALIGCAYGDLPTGENRNQTIQLNNASVRNTADTPQSYYEGYYGYTDNTYEERQSTMPLLHKALGDNAPQMTFSTATPETAPSADEE